MVQPQVLMGIFFSSGLSQSQLESTCSEVLQSLSILQHIFSLGNCHRLVTLNYTLPDLSAKETGIFNQFISRLTSISESEFWNLKLPERRFTF